MNATLRTYLAVLLVLAVVSVAFLFPHVRTPARRRAEKIAWSACTLDDDFDSFEPEIDRLAKEDSVEADEVLASLVSTYFGEHNSEVLDIAIVNRGPRMKPWLVKLREKPIKQLACYRILSDKERKSFVDWMIHAIDNGEHWQE